MSNAGMANDSGFDTNVAQERIEVLARDSAIWISDYWQHVLIAAGAGAAIFAVLHLFRTLGAKLARERDEDVATGWGVVIGRAIRRTTNFFLVMVAAKLVDGYAAAPPAVTTAIDFLFTVAAVFQAALWAREIIIGAVVHRTERENHGEGLASALGIIRLLVTVALFSIALIVVLDNLGVNVTGLVAGLGVGGIAIGLAAQGIFADLFAALSIIFDRPFRRGDAVSYDSTSGNIEAIGLKSTRIRSATGEQRIVANRKLLDKEILNNTRRVHHRATFAIGVTYQTPPDVCAAIPAMLEAVVRENGLVFVRSGFTGFGASSLDFELIFDSLDADYDPFYAARTAIGIAILRRFNAEGIDIAYPTQTSFTAAPDGRLVMPYPDERPTH